jgi:hypothetical protein
MIETRAALQQIADALTAGGVPAAVDPRDVTIPGAWVQRVWRAQDLLGDAVTLRIRVLLVSPDVGAWDALGHLDAMYDLAYRVVPPNTGTPALDRTVLLPGSSTPYPATSIEADIQVTPDQP